MVGSVGAPPIVARRAWRCRSGGAGRGAAGTHAPAPAFARPPREEEANHFAAALLMPARLVELHYRRMEGNFDRLCRLFDSSGAAMGRRLHAVIPRADQA